MDASLQGAERATMKKPSRRQIRAIGVGATLVVSAILICFALGILPESKLSPKPGAVLKQGTAEGIRFEQSDELRGRMLRVMARREAETSIPLDREGIHLQKLYDGALLCFVEVARQVWPELDPGSLSGCLLYKDETEKILYMEQAHRLIGDRCIDKPEDITFWINKVTLARLLEQDTETP